ncbi:DUF402 domain-containing protein [Nocardiopsis sp. NPDC101807]|uniref:DUF402 domain-containing protein n=1 Tax=Nocardiopsis sp. NPDC101807 TaxID=3364339 RepID=UPI003812D515
MNSSAGPQVTGVKGFGHGAIVRRRDVLDGRTWIGYPVRVVVDSPGLVALYLSRGTRLDFGTGRFSWGAHPWSHVGDLWQSAGVLQLHRPGSRHSVWVVKDPDTGGFRQWYVNLEAPLRREAGGFSTLDHEIDLIVPAGASRCRWKDLDKFERRVRSGHFSAAEAAAIRAEAAGLAESIREGTQWWDSGWSRWKAPDSWGPLALRTSEKEGF